MTQLTNMYGTSPESWVLEAATDRLPLKSMVWLTVTTKQKANHQVSAFVFRSCKPFFVEKIRSSQSIGYWHIPLPLVCNIVHSLIYDKHRSLWRTNFIFNYLLIPLNVILQAGFSLGSSIRLTMRETLKLTSLFGLNLIHRRTSFCLISDELSCRKLMTFDRVRV